MWKCAMCGKVVNMNIDGEPESNYWQLPDVFCGGRCSLDWYKEKKNG